MKKLISIILFSLSLIHGFSQVFNSGYLSEKGKFSAGIEPAYFISGNSGTPLLFLYGNYGLRDDIGINLKVGTDFSKTYLGAAMTWDLGKNFTLGTGVHNFDFFGLDARLNYNIPLPKDARIFTGLDASVIFANEARLPLWLPLGVEVRIKDKLSFILETEIALTKPAYHIISAGVAYYF
jgi:hypothetical protein